MFTPPEPPKILAYFGATGEVASLHQGEDFSARLEHEIRIHQGQIQAENLLLNTVANYQQISERHHIPREDFNQILRDSKYNLEHAKNAMIAKYGIAEMEFNQPINFDPIDTADYMRQRAAMMGAVLSSTPVLLRDPWNGRPATSKYGFNDFKSEVDGVGFSAIATPRYKGIPFRFAVMKHDHDGFADNNPAMIMSNEFCDAFAEYNKVNYGNLPPDQHPLIMAMATNLKPNIHDRFHNWLLYDTNAASDTFKQWGSDIYFVEHTDKNPLLINYEQIALCFHLYTYQTLFDKNPELKGQMYDRLHHCMEEIKKFGEYLKETNHPHAEAIEESTIYAVLSNICFVLNPYEERFQQILNEYPDIHQKLLEVRDDGKGIGATLERLHGYEHGVPSQKYGGAKEAAIEYILRYPLVDEIRAKLKAERSQGKPDDWQMIGDHRIYTMNLRSYNELPPALKTKIHTMPDSNILPKLNGALQNLPDQLREEYIRRVHVSEEGYFFFRMEREELDYTQFEKHQQQKKVLLIDVPQGVEVKFTNEKNLSIKDRVKKQYFHLVGGKDVLAINIRDENAAKTILTYAQTVHGIDPQRAIDKAHELAAMTGEKSAGDMYKIERSVAASEGLYNFKESGFYQTRLEKHVARAAGPIIMQLHAGGDQRLVKGAFIYLPLGKSPSSDDNPDCHLIENTDFKRDYNAPEGTDILCAVRLKQGSPLMQDPAAEQVLETFLQTLHEINFQITHGAEKASSLSQSGKGLFT